MTLTDLLRETISWRSFPSLWYWLVLIALWWLTGRRVLGVPFDLVVRARRDPNAAQELDTVTHIFAGRILRRMEHFGPLIVAAATALLVTLMLSATWYGGELAQALLFVAVPLIAIRALEWRVAGQITALGEHGETLQTRLIRLRLAFQVITLIAIPAAVLYGMYHNLTSMFPG